MHYCNVIPCDHGSTITMSLFFLCLQEGFVEQDMPLLAEIYSEELKHRT